MAGVAVLVVAAFWAVNVQKAKAPGDGIACTQEAKLCPDGSYVGRTGPNCEFTECPAVATTTVSSTVSLQVRMGQKVSGGGVTITPFALLEDSRCPVDVQCIQAGTVRVKATLESGLGTASQEFKLGQIVTTEAETITLTTVTPQKMAGVSIKSSEYVFTFEVTKRTTTGGGSILPYTSGVRGTVSLGPTCPVMRNPPDPACADKPYATTITVYRTNSSSVFATGRSDEKGAFQFSLPPGSYTLSASGGTTLPRCSPVAATVASTGYVIANISCDTGIR